MSYLSSILIADKEVVHGRGGEKVYAKFSHQAA